MTTTTTLAPAEFNTIPYIMSHGKAPRGKGTWGFVPVGRWNRNDPNWIEHVWFAPFGSFTDAKRAAREHFSKVSTATVNHLVVAP